jgi:hypothetical protein
MRPQGARQRSGELQGPVVIAMIAMRMMEASAHQVIDVIPVRHGFVTAGRAMLVRAARLRRALHGVGGIDRDGVLVDMVVVHVVQMPVVQVIDVAFMAHRRMPAVGTMLVGMIGMMLLGARSHDGGSFLPRSETGPGVYDARQIPFIPAQAGIQGHELGPRFRRDERKMLVPLPFRQRAPRRFPPRAEREYRMTNSRCARR